ncbi:MAG: hypothetical protein QF773_10095, partial [Lentisphaeria bacterium]|nr:hypothetical protein [Lentisphaeria bacterium]
WRFTIGFYELHMEAQMRVEGLKKQKGMARTAFITLLNFSSSRLCRRQEAMALIYRDWSVVQGTVSQ